MIEQIFLDTESDQALTRYTRLRDALAAAESALKTHQEMAARVESRLTARVDSLREQLQAEINTIRTEINRRG